MDKASLLKQKGNEAFKMGKLDDALNWYSQAITMAKDADKSLTAVLLSNRAQVYLEQKQFKSALNDANNALDYDSTFNKSMLRRAVAYCELGDKSSAVEDLRVLFKQEPRNKAVRLMMRRCRLPCKMNSNLSQFYIKHYFRRFLATNPGVLTKGVGDRTCSMMSVFLRQLFLSAQNCKITGRFFDMSKINIVPFIDKIIVTLFSWTLCKSMTFDPRPTFAMLYLHRCTFQIICQLVQPVNISLSIITSDCVARFGNFYNCEHVHYQYETAMINSRPEPKIVRLFKNSNQKLTRIPYFADLVNFQNVAFPKLKQLIVQQRVVVDLEFLKFWQQSQWNVDTLIFINTMPNLFSFKCFSGAVSDRVTKVFIPFLDDTFGESMTVIKPEQIVDNLATLKRVFPALTEVTGTFKSTIFHRVSQVIIKTILKQFIIFLATQICKIKPSWCACLKVLVEFGEIYRQEELMRQNFVVLEHIVKECRHDVNELKWIRLRGPSQCDFYWDLTAYGYALIEMATDDVEIQIMFFVAPSLDST